VSSSSWSRISNFEQHTGTFIGAGFDSISTASSMISGGRIWTKWRALSLSPK
jgi:hypothetical protein